MALLKYEFAAPTVTELGVDEIRLPVPREVVVVRGVHGDDFRSGRVGSLRLQRGATRFSNNHTKWHYDYSHSQAHLTVEGKCRIRLSTLVSEGLGMPVPEYIVNLIPDMERNMAQIESAAGDMVIFHGAFTMCPEFHDVKTLEKPRISLLTVPARLAV